MSTNNPMTADGALAVVDRTFKSAREYRAKNDEVDVFDHHDLLNDEIAAKDTLEALVARNAELEAERDAAMGNIHDEIAANMAFRDAGGALDDEDMPTFCARLIAERDAITADNLALREALLTYLDCDRSRDVGGDTPARQARAALARTSAATKENVND